MRKESKVYSDDSAQQLSTMLNHKFSNVTQAYMAISCSPSPAQIADMVREVLSKKDKLNTESDNVSVNDNDGDQP